MRLLFMFGSKKLNVFSNTCTERSFGNVLRARDFVRNNRAKKNEVPAMIKRTREVERKEKLVWKNSNMDQTPPLAYSRT